MKILLEWLKELVDFDLSASQLADKLTNAGLETGGLSDDLLEVEVPPNRGDVLSLIGLAREVAALEHGVLKEKKVIIKEDTEDTAFFPMVEVVSASLCPRYCCRVVREVRVGPSPDWLKGRLEKSGIKSVNNVVDATNYILLERGQPLHAFDNDLLAGQKIIVRPARPGEKLVCLDEKERSLDETILVVADEQGPVALAGIMGGKGTAINAQTKNVLLESAYFDPVTIRRGVQTLGLSTEASYRFERKVDWHNVAESLDRGAELIVQVAGGRILKGYLDRQREEIKSPRIILTWEKVKAVLGLKIDPEEIKAVLERLGFSLKIEASRFIVDVPSFRNDVKEEVDLIEEIARHYGYENIPLSFPTCQVYSSCSSGFRDLEKDLGRVMVNLGFKEVINYSFFSQKDLDWLGLSPENVLRIANPLSSEQEFLQPTLLGGLLNNAVLNLNRQNSDFKLFEIGRIFLPHPEGILPLEKRMLAGLLSGSPDSSWWREASPPVDFYDLRGVLDSIFTHLKIRNWSVSFSPAPLFHPYQGGWLLVNDEVLGKIGRLAGSVREKYKIDQDIYFLELEIEKLFQFPQEKQYRPFSRYPAVRRDISLVVDQQISAEKIKEEIENKGQPLLKEIFLKDIYTRAPVPPDKKGMTFSLVYRSENSTLVEEEVDKKNKEIISALEAGFSVRMRE